MSLHCADSMELLDSLEEDSVHAVVTDPPYGLAFMGKSWDDFEPVEYQEWCEKWAKKALRVTKPGGHMIAFSGNRTHHRLFAGVEDAGWEIRDTITWHYGSGFPKALDVAKSIDKRKGVDRTVVGKETVDVGMQGGSMHAGRDSEVVEIDKTIATSPEAVQWEGWKSALKPATEYAMLARKPFNQTIAENMIEHGTGALNIDACRIPTDEDTSVTIDHTGEYSLDDENSNFAYSEGEKTTGGHAEGRYPANVVFDEIEAQRLDLQTGDTSDGGNAGNKYDYKESIFGNSMSGGASSYDDQGGPSRYFYTSKASKSERTHNGKVDNPHPTVKPLDLMKWLITLVTAEGQTVLDPFAGSGTTLIAAELLKREWIGVDQAEEYIDIINERMDNLQEMDGYDEYRVSGFMEW